MRCRLVPLLALAANLAVPAFAQSTGTAPPVPPGVNPVTGARPGNEIGTGMSLPLSNEAGNITPSDTTSRVAGRLPEPEVGPNASVRDYLMAARNALAAGRTGEAQEALERAETRSLDRSVPLFQTSTPSADPTVERIRQALAALGNGNRMEAMRLLEQAIAAEGK